MNEQELLGVLLQASENLRSGFKDLPVATSPPLPPRFEQVLLQTAERLRENYPYHHPFYAGQMMKPPHPIARLAYALAMSLNPNNHAIDGGPASSAMEKEAVAELAAMVGWSSHLGHLCSGGTMANLEALWIAGQLQPGKKIVGSEQAHYTHERISGVLRLSYQKVPADLQGRMNLDALRELLVKEEVGTVIATLGTTALGAVDPLPELLELRERYGFRLHVDAAYGGYFGLVDNLKQETRRVYACLDQVDSLVIDPHKHGLQPYGCGCVLFRDPTIGRFYKHDSPYTYFTSADLHLGEISLECSRPGAAAVALWATQKLLPLVRAGEFAGMLSESRAAALSLHERILSDDRFIGVCAPELDIVVWATRADQVTQASTASRKLFQEAAQRHLHLALVTLPAECIVQHAPGMEPDSPTITCLRSVLMKPEHRSWTGQIWQLFLEASKQVL